MLVSCQTPHIITWNLLHCRYESPYWRSRAAILIQVAWRYRRKHLNRANTSQSNHMSSAVHCPDTEQSNRMSSAAHRGTSSMVPFHVDYGHHLKLWDSILLMEPWIMTYTILLVVYPTIVWWRSLFRCASPYRSWPSYSYKIQFYWWSLVMHCPNTLCMKQSGQLGMSNLPNPKPWLCMWASWAFRFSLI